MKWPWQKRAEALEADLIADQKRAELLEQQREIQRRMMERQWEKGQQEVERSRYHRRENHITDLIVGVAQGRKKV